jgi:hypothetical protein
MNFSTAIKCLQQLMGSDTSLDELVAEISANHSPVVSYAVYKLLAAVYHDEEIDWCTVQRLNCALQHVDQCPHNINQPQMCGKCK